MSTQQLVGRYLSAKAGVDLSDKIYHLVMLNANGDIVLATINARVIGVLHNKPRASEACLIALGETSKVVLDGTVAVGDELISSADGQAMKVPTTAGDYNVFGIALQSGTAGDLIEVLLRPYVKKV